MMKKRLLLVAVVLSLAAGRAPAQTGQGLTAFEKARQEGRIMRQQSLARIRELLGGVEPLVAARRYADAGIQLRAAKRIVKSGRYLSTAEQGKLMAEVGRLDQLLETGQAEYLRVHREKTAQEISRRDAKRRKSAIGFAERRRAAHWSRLRQFRDQRKYTKALSEARAILARNANDETARRAAEQMTFQAEAAQQYDLRLTRRGETRKSLADVEASTIPYSKILRYGGARRWEELTRRRLSGLLRKSGTTTRRLQAPDRLDRRINLDMEGVTLANVSTYLGEATGVPIVIDPHLQADTGKSADDETVTVHIKQVTLRQALNIVLPEEMGWRQEGGQIIISSREKANPLKVRTYAILNLTAKVPDFGKTVPRMRLAQALDQTNSSSGGGTNIFDTTDNTSNDSSTTTQPQERIIELIKRFVTSGDPRVAEWDDNGGTATIEYFNGLLIVNQTEAGQLKVAALLARF